MRSIATLRFCCIAFFLGIASACVEAAPPMSWDRGSTMSFSVTWPGRNSNTFMRAQYPGPRGPQMSYGQPIQRGYAPGWSGAQSGMPSRQPYSSSSWQVSAQPRLEVEISQPSAYASQSVVYTIRTVSSNNIKTINLDLPVIAGAVLDKIDGPVTKLRRRGRGSEIVNEYQFALTPLNDGEVVIPTVRVSGTQVVTNQWGQPSSESSFDVVSNRPLSLQVKPPVADVRPWLPLRSLQIDGKLGQPGRFEPGEPLTLSVQLSALGASGGRLPTVEAQLQTPGVRVYREASHATQSVSAGGRELRGYKTETYTLVPLEGETIKLPTLRVAWWNVDTDEAEEAVFPIASLFGAAVGSNLADQTDASSGSPIKLSIWMPFLIILIATVSYWLGLWSSDSRLAYRIKRRLGQAWEWLGGRIAIRQEQILSRLAFRKRNLGVQNHLVNWLPMSFRLWFCARCVEHESRPSEWCRTFRSMAGKHLGMSQQAPLPEIANKIIEVHPGVQPTKLHTLVSALDGAIYGSETLDFGAWKKDFKRQIRPHPLARKSNRGKKSAAELPNLNPKAA